MRKSPHKVAALTIVAAALAGCSAFSGGPKLARNMAPPTHHNLAAANSSVEQGRQFLDAGQYGQAIEAFQIALVSGEPAAPAYNGLGVAFARLGRFELAERYFQRAVAMDPTDQRYVLNLANLIDASGAASGSRIQLTEAKCDTTNAVDRAPGLVLASSQEAGRLQRVGKGQVFIQSTPAQSAPVRMANAQVDPRFKAVASVDLAPLPKSGAAVPVQPGSGEPRSRSIKF